MYSLSQPNKEILTASEFVHEYISYHLCTKGVIESKYDPITSSAILNFSPFALENVIEFLRSSTTANVFDNDTALDLISDIFNYQIIKESNMIDVKDLTTYHSQSASIHGFVNLDHIDDDLSQKLLIEIQLRNMEDDIGFIDHVTSYKLADFSQDQKFMEFRSELLLKYPELFKGYLEPFEA